MDPSAPAGSPMTVTVAFGRSSFVGRSLVAALLESSPDLAVRVADPLLPPPPPGPHSDRALYITTRFDDVADIRAAVAGSSAVFLVDPTLGVRPTSGVPDFVGSHKLIVQGARNVVRACWECGILRLVYTGSADVVSDGVHDVVAADESLPYPDSFKDVVNDLRAQAEMLILDANGRNGLSTCVLRASNPFGAGDDYLVPLLIGKAKSVWSKFIIGNGKNLCDFTYVENVAHANIRTEQILSTDATSVAGKPFFITNYEHVKFWDFNSDILEGLGYQRPQICLPTKLVLLLVTSAEWMSEKWHLSRASIPFLNPTTLHVFSCTKTFNSSKTQRIIEYSPITSLQDGVLATVESFSQLVNGLPCIREQEFSKPSKAEVLLGNGEVAHLLLWRDEKKTFTYLLGLFLLLHWFLLSGRTFISSTARLLLLVTVVLFSQGILPSSMFGFTIEKTPSSYFEVSELAVRRLFTCLASIWNSGVYLLKSVYQGGDWVALIKVGSSLYLVKLLLRFPLSALTSVGVICLFSTFLIYEQCEEEIHKLATIALAGFTKSTQSLSARISNFLASYSHKS